MTWELIDVFIDVFIQNDCAEDALRLKWLKTIL